MPGVSAELRARRPDVATLERDALGARLKRRRIEVGLRQLDAAALLGVSEGTFVHWEREQRAPPVRYFPAIIRFLGYEPWPEPLTLAGQLRAERLRRGMSVKGAARHLQIDEGTFANWESEKHPPSAKLQEICDRFLGRG